ncbi:diguanylate cyclase domain-containing protein [Zavarzinia sp. CC-PAN008]|uniref:diguanylate cyclase domain-containing protein n=1 Tax=Zavarzinia sp. CC-PAN008 TaxID=3243332 RepID=UPI003F74420A
MDGSILMLGLMGNLGVAIAVAFAFTLIATGNDRLPPWRRSVLTGGMFGVATVLCMLSSIEVRPGIFFDARSAVLVLSGPFGGPIGAAVATVITGSARAILGGPIAFLVVANHVATGLISAAAWWWGVRGESLPRLPIFLFLGISQALQSILISYVGVEQDLYVQIAPLYAVGIPLGTILVGWLLTQQLKAVAAVRDLKSAHDRVRVSETRFRLLADHVTDIVALHRLDSTALYASPSIAKVLGYAPEEVVGKPASDLIQPGFESLMRDAIADLADKPPGTVGQVEVPMRHADGHFVWIESAMRIVEGDDGPLLVVASRDVSERRSAAGALAEANAELARMAMTDSLTGLPNRRRFDDAFAQEWRRAERSGAPLAFLMVDVDCFKLYNDNHGHQAGDDCLRRVAQALAGVVARAGDMAARYGGEEFAVLLPGATLDGAARVGERLRAAVEALAIPHLTNSAGPVVTVSVGGCVFNSGELGATPRTAADLVAVADALLYEAKRTGRNRVIVSATGPAASPLHSPADEAKRLAAVNAYIEAGAVETGSADLDAVAELAARLFNTPVGLVSVVTAGEQVFPGRSGMDVDRTSREVSFCAHTITGSDPLIVTDASSDMRFARNPLVTGDPHIRFYAGAPLVSPLGGERLGALCVIDTVPRQPLTRGQKAMLSALADLAVEQLENRRRAADARRQGEPAQQRR